MDILLNLFKPGSVGLAVLVLSVVAALGLALGSIRVRGLSLGIGGVLFAGLFLGYYLPYATGTDGNEHKALLTKEILEFVREFGLILFVYTIGVQVGPGFLASLRKQGLPLNLMAAGIVLLGVVTTIVIHKVAKVELPVAVGLFSGGTTNTPSMGAAQEAIKGLPKFAQGGAEPATRANGAAYAIAYPFGIMGIILTMVFMRFIFRVNLKSEDEALARQQEHAVPLTSINLEVNNPNLDGKPIRKIPALDEGGVVISRVLHDNKLQVALPSTVLHTGDVLLAVGLRERLEELQLIVGSISKRDLKSVQGPITTRRILVTQRSPLGKTVEELNLMERFGVTVTRIIRGEVELSPAPTVDLQFGDRLIVVGEESNIKRVAAELGDSPKRLDHPQIIPVFVGIALGVILGSLPLPLWHVPAPVKLGLAGGPLVMAIILSRLGHFGPLVWFLPTSANFILRELGIVLFLSAVGYKSGTEFVHSFFREGAINPQGFIWMGYAAIITALPLLVVALIGRIWLKTNYMTLCGVLAGSMTDPPALAFAGAVTGSEGPSVAYATVYPLTMLLRVLTAQAMVLMFM